MAVPRFLKELAAGLFESLTSKSTSRTSSKPRSKGRENERGGGRGKGDVTSNHAPADARNAGRERRGDTARRSGSGETLTARSISELPGTGETPKVYSVADLGLPEFDYSPREDNFPDPGEVVWTWVPYEEDRSQGKDRPVLVLAEIERCIVFAQLTSKDHDRDAEQEARNGRFWIDVGSGGWDSKGRPSEARIDRLLCVAPEQMRREGGSLDEARFTQVVAAIRRFHR